MCLCMCMCVYTVDRDAKGHENSNRGMTVRKGGTGVIKNTVVRGVMVLLCHPYLMCFSPIF